LNNPKVVIFLTVFIYLLGFGMIIPVIPLLSTYYGASPLQAGLLLSVFSLMQFIFSPVWGKLSDRYGRRPILLICLVGETLSYLVFAWARSLEMLFVARILTGFFGASISTASAYISDVTSQQERSKGMAMIGAAFGLGFLFGPALGGGLTLYAETISNDPQFIGGFSSYGVALLCLLTTIFAFFYLKETLSDENRRRQAKKQGRLDLILKYLRMPVVGSLVFTFGITSLSMSLMEATLVLFMKERFAWGIKEVSFGFAYVGLCIVITQGLLVRKLIPVLGERNLLRLGLGLMIVGMGGIAFAEHLWMMAVVQTLLALGSGFVNPSILGSISLLVTSDEQGLALGTTQSLSALGRVIGPALGGLVFSTLSIASPFILSSFLLASAFLLVLSIFALLPMSGRRVETI
jgi:MFS transporter, DHA1 family, tetracycline resistance protein